MCRRMAVPMAVVLGCGTSMGNLTAPEEETESGDGMTAVVRRVAVGDAEEGLGALSRRPVVWWGLTGGS